MNSAIKYIKAASLGLVLGAAGVFSGCTPEEITKNNGLTDTSLSPSFTIEPVQGKNNTYVFKIDPKGVLGVKWDKGTGAGLVAGKGIDTVFYPDAGDYTITFEAMGRGGAKATTSQTLNVPTSDPVAGNLVVGGKMNDSDASAWNKIIISAGVDFVLKDGKMIASGGNWGHAAIYQQINVEANKKYKFGMNVSGNGATDTWFEVYFGKKAPENGVDYSDGGKKFGLNTWGGCGSTPFNGDIAIIGCDAQLAGKNGEIMFAESGPVYLLIKTGGANLGTGGISIDNVELRGSK
jgi:hypothetical protein